MTNTREENGQLLCQQVNRIDERTYSLNSQSGNGSYTVISSEIGWKCPCPDHAYRGVKCKHIWACQLSTELHKKVEESVQVVIKPISDKMCPRCRSDKIIKRGIRHSKLQDVQRYYCYDCGKWYILNQGFERMYATPKMITSAMQLYFSGESLRNVQKFFKLQGVKISHVAIYKWIGKYVTLMQGYLKQITPKVGDVWRSHELYVKIKGNNKYLFALMDDQTRFWIAQQVSERKNTSDISPLFKKGKEIAQKRPNVLITDGAPNFNVAFKNEFFTVSNPRTKHIRHIRWQGDHNNNKMERMNGEVRDREKVMRGLKITETPILQGYQLFHNYIRPHMALNGRTPADLCGIQIEGQNKWLTLIQNAVFKEVK